MVVADIAEEVQASWLIHTKEQMEYVRINKEYNFVKKSSLANYLINQQESMRNHFQNFQHARIHWGLLKQKP